MPASQGQKKQGPRKPGAKKTVPTEAAAVEPEEPALEPSAEPPADAPNRAARRARGKRGDQPPAVGKVHYTGRGKPASQPRQWANRRSG